MKKFVTSAVLSAILVFFVSVGSAFAGWHDLTQTGRNHAIHDEAVANNNTYGGECKPWVQNIVSWASGGVVTVPLTTNNGHGYTWEYSPDVGEMYNGIEDLNVHVGMIVQMRIKYSDGSYGPHTAIIYQKNSSGITWIESNYSGDGMVCIRYYFETYQHFYDSLEYPWSYSIYYIK